MNESLRPTVEAPVALGEPDEAVPLIFRILGAARELETRVEAALDKIGLSPAKAGVLRALAKAGDPMPLSELAACNKCVKSNVTQLIDRLEADGLVRRISDPDDRRVTRASLTHEGRMAYNQAKRVVQQQERELFRLLGDEEAAALTRMLEQLSA
jgi:DNA-binding MarR family transcriptional regulator